MWDKHPIVTLNVCLKLAFTYNGLYFEEKWYQYKLKIIVNQLEKQMKTGALKYASDITYINIENIFPFQFH